ncbi:MAG: 30S ribosomal protein S12 methylthiotransferase RimO [Lachnospiraceae bacterium]|nr:30S ribosomal protein S12 methylthiotransferase RimO [Lachnospiraceae bacterium]
MNDLLKVFFVSLGCDKNLVDSEKMISLLQRNGFELTYDELEADIIVVNSCCFIDSAKEESINTILEMASLKGEGGACKCLVLAGCLAQRYAQDIKTELPEVDVVIGTTAFDQIVTAVSAFMEGEGHDVIKDINDDVRVGTQRAITTPGHYEFLKIAEGCSKHCTYCIIPKVRGEYRSVPMDELLEEAGMLAEGGVKELIIVAQESTVYGMDLYGKKMLPELLRKLCAIEGFHWIRLLYCYPEEIDDELIRVIKEEKKILHYIDMPIQHSEDRILKRMGRRTSRADIENIIGQLRKEIPDIAIRTSIIAGFPSETEEEHEALLDFIKKMRFDRLGCFTYSQEENTPAAAFEGQIDEDTKIRYRDEIMSLQQEIAEEKTEELIGKEFEVFIEGRIPEDGVYVGRTYRDAPGVDGLIFVDEIGMARELMTGDYINVNLVGGNGYDLKGKVNG